MKTGETYGKSLQTVNKVLEYYYKTKGTKNYQLILDGIPLCHLTHENLIKYALDRKSYQSHTKSELQPEQNYYIDVEDADKVLTSEEIGKWDKPICPKEDCLYKKICRLNTLIGNTDFLKDWIN